MVQPPYKNFARCVPGYPTLSACGSPSPFHPTSWGAWQGTSTLPTWTWLNLSSKSFRLRIGNRDKAGLGGSWGWGDDP